MTVGASKSAVSLLTICILLGPRGGALGVDVCRLSIRRSVIWMSCAWTNPELKGIGSWKLAGRKPMTWYGWPVIPFRDQKVKGQGHQPLNIVTENHPYVPNGKAYNLETWCANGSQKPASLTCSVTSKTESCVWFFKSLLAGGGGILWRPLYRLQSLLMCVSSP